MSEIRPLIGGNQPTPGYPPPLMNNNQQQQQQYYYQPPMPPQLQQQQYQQQYQQQQQQQQQQQTVQYPVQSQEECQFSLSKSNWLFLTTLFYCATMSVVLLFLGSTNYFITSLNFQRWAGLVYDGVSCAGAVVFGLVLTNLKPHHHHHHNTFHNQFIPMTILLTVVSTVVASILLFVSVDVPALVWIFTYISSFFVGGCTIVMMTLLGWNTNQRNAPFWFGLVGAIRGILSFNIYSIFYDYEAGRLIACIPLWCIAFILIVWVLASNVNKRSRVLIPYYLNHGQRVVFSNTLWLVYFGLVLLSLFIALYDYMIVAYLSTLIYDQQVNNYFSFYQYNALSIGCGFLVGGLGTGLHHWG